MDEHLWIDYNFAAKKIGEFASSSPIAARRNAEQNYGIAYQRLVVAGLVPQIRKRYRRA